MAAGLEIGFIAIKFYWINGWKNSVRCADNKQKGAAGAIHTCGISMGKDLKGKELGKGIVQRKDGTYCARCMVTGVSVCLYGTNYQQLKKDLEKAKEKIKAGMNPTVDYTVEEWFNIWFDTYKTPTIKQSSINPMKRKVKATFLPYIGSKKLTEVKNIDIQNIVKVLLDEGRIAQSSISEALSRLQDCFASAVNNQYMTTNPAFDIIVPFKEEPWKERRWFTPKEIGIFLNEAKESQPFFVPMLYIMLWTGLRIGEVAGLKWQDVYIEQGYIKLQQALYIEYKDGVKHLEFTTLKTPNSYRKIPFIGNVKEMFLKQKEQVEALKRKLGHRYRSQGEFADLVFVNTMGAPMIRYNAEKLVNKIVKEINYKESIQAKLEGREPVIFEKAYPHALRHTFASICYQSGIDVKRTQKLMGHAKLSTTLDIYTHIGEVLDIHESSQLEALNQTINGMIQDMDISDDLSSEEMKKFDKLKNEKFV